MAWVRCCGGSKKKSNPVIFENGAFADGISQVHCPYSSGAPYGNDVPFIANDYINSNSQNGAYSGTVYLTFNLSDYEGKTLYMDVSTTNGAFTVKAFSITSQSKRIAYGCFSDGSFRQCYGICNELAPTYLSSNADLQVINNGSYNTSPSQPALRIRKIWIAD